MSDYQKPDDNISNDLKIHDNKKKEIKGNETEIKALFRYAKYHRTKLERKRNIRDRDRKEARNIRDSLYYYGFPRSIVNHLEDIDLREFKEIMETLRRQENKKEDE